MASVAQQRRFAIDGRFGSAEVSRSPSKPAACFLERNVCRAQHERRLRGGSVVIDSIHSARSLGAAHSQTECNWAYNKNHSGTSFWTASREFFSLGLYSKAPTRQLPQMFQGLGIEQLRCSQHLNLQPNTQEWNVPAFLELPWHGILTFEIHGARNESQPQTRMSAGSVLAVSPTCICKAHNATQALSLHDCNNCPATRFPSLRHVPEHRENQGLLVQGPQLICEFQQSLRTLLVGAVQESRGRPCRRGRCLSDPHCFGSAP